MVKRIGGARRKTRNLLSKNFREKGKISVTRFLQSFNEGDKVLLNAEPAYHKGLYEMRFHGKTGFVKEARGRCYAVEILDRGVKKELIVHPIHLRLIA